MLKFEPPELENKLRDAISAVKERLDLEHSDFCDDIPDLTEQDFDAANEEDRTISEDASVTVFLPRSEEDYTTMSVGEFVDFATELKSAELNENSECLTDRRRLVRVSAANEKASLFFYHVDPEGRTAGDDETKELIAKLRNERDEIWRKKIADRTATIDTGRLLELSNELGILKRQLRRWPVSYLTSVTTVDGVRVEVSVTNGFSFFGAMIAASGAYEKYYPPILPDDLFVQAVYPPGTDPFLIETLIEAYTFELSASVGIDLVPQPRAELDEFNPDERPFEKRDFRLRPLTKGKGVYDVSKLYNTAIGSQDTEVQILYFTKVAEYVSSTVTKLEMIERVRGKLVSSRALDPDAGFISELAVTFEEIRAGFGDKEAVRKTIVRCCDAVELAPRAPRCVNSLRQCNEDTRVKEQRSALSDLAICLYDTRSQIVHAKANYSATGQECPREQYSELADCARIAAQQLVRWYCGQSEALRVT